MRVREKRLLVKYRREARESATQGEEYRRESGERKGEGEAAGRRERQGGEEERKDS